MLRLDESALAASFDPAAFKAAQIYTGNWADPRERDWIMDAFQKVRDYFCEASDHGRNAQFHDLMKNWLTTGSQLGDYLSAFPKLGEVVLGDHPVPLDPRHDLFNCDVPALNN